MGKGRCWLHWWKGPESHQDLSAGLFVSFRGERRGAGLGPVLHCTAVIRCRGTLSVQTQSKHCLCSCLPTLPHGQGLSLIKAFSLAFSWSEEVQLPPGQIRTRTGSAQRLHSRNLKARVPSLAGSDPNTQLLGWGSTGHTTTKMSLKTADLAERSLERLFQGQLVLAWFSLNLRREAARILAWLLQIHGQMSCGDRGLGGTGAALEDHPLAGTSLGSWWAMERTGSWTRWARLPSGPAQLLF